MRVLLTNIWLDQRAGTEMVVRDVALGLQRRGHRPVVYTPAVGAVAEEIRERGVTVVDDLRLITEAPDVIHGHHLVPTAEAIIRFPDVPALSWCHGAVWWMEAPAVFPQVRRYGAVDVACRDRLVGAHGIDPSAVVVLYNAVDLDRFALRADPLPEKPARALAFTKTAAQLEAVRRACAELGIELDTLGLGVDRMVADPERELLRYDLVFATARSALEAMATGAAVVVCDGRGLAGMVTTASFSYLRDRNFGLRSLVHDVTTESVREAILAYDASDAAAVAARVREEAALADLLDQLELLYGEVIDEHRHAPVDADAYRDALVGFLRENLPRWPTDARWPWQLERDWLLGREHNLDRHAANLARGLAVLQDEVAAAHADAAAARAEAAELAAQLDARRDRTRLLRRWRWR